MTKTFKQFSMENKHLRGGHEKYSINDDVFSYGKYDYNIPAILERVKDIQPRMIPVDQLESVIVPDSKYRTKINKTKLDEPIVIAKLGGKMVVVDGQYRLRQAKLYKLKVIATRFANDHIMSQCRIHQKH